MYPAAAAIVYHWYSCKAMVTLVAAPDGVELCTGITRRRLNEMNQFICIGLLADFITRYTLPVYLW